METRVVITAVGIASPAGFGIGPFWEHVGSGRTMIGLLSHPEPDLKTRVGGEIVGFEASDWIPKSLKPHRLGRAVQLCAAAASQVLPGLTGRKISVVLGTASSNLDVIEASVRNVVTHGPQNAHPTLVQLSPPQSMVSTVAALASHFGAAECSGLTVSSACASGADAVGQAFYAIKSGRTLLALAGGADSPLTLCPLAELENAGLSNVEQDPILASRPFDLTRSSGVLAEGACVFVMEELQHARVRGAEILAEIVGYGQSIDPKGTLPCTALDTAIGAAMDGISQDEIDYVCAWGPGHPLIDVQEVKAVKSAFKKRAYEIPMSSIKGVIGNPLAAAGPMQLAAAVMGMRSKTIPPTANLWNSDPECDLDHVALHSRRGWIRNAVCNSHGVGGTNSAVLVRNYR